MSQERSILVLGASGQLGRQLCRRLGSRAVAVDRSRLDVTDGGAIGELLRSTAPEVVVNATAYNLVDEAERSPAAAFAVNCFAVRDLARACQSHDARFVHFSTDYVFGIDRVPRVPFRETDLPSPGCMYAISKIGGEQAALGYCDRALVIRTCGLYGEPSLGGKGGNFVETMLRLGRERKSVRVVNDQTCTPTYTMDLADAAVGLIDQEVCGLIHWTNSGQCTWYELAVAIFGAAKLDAECVPISSADYGAAARRPAYSVLDCTAAVAAGLSTPRHWTAALSAYLSERSAAR